MKYHRILTVQDISCVGQCSLTVALPILSACGQEACILPSAVLSTHTGGFSGYTVRDLTDDIPGIHQHWQKEHITFDAIYTGYLGSLKQIDYVADIFRTMAPGGRIIVDPAMADNGKLYWGFDDAYAKAMAKLCAQADVILPNVTEACFMTDYPYQENYDEPYIAGLLDALTAIGAGDLILTGISYEPETTGVLIRENGKVTYYRHEKMPKSYHGTGDVYASAFVGSWISGRSMQEAARLAADYTLRSIQNTIGDDSHWYGVKFESAIPVLVKELF